MLTWETTLQEIGNDENFAIPFWESKTQCEPAICSEELLGVTKQVGGTVKGKYFDNWCVICTSEQTHFSTKMCDPMNKKTGLERITEKEMEGKVRKQGYTMTNQSKKKSTLHSGLKLLTCHPMAKSQAANFKKILEGYVSAKTGYPLPNVHTF